MPSKLEWTTGLRELEQDVPNAAQQGGLEGTQEKLKMTVTLVVAGEGIKKP